MGARRHRLKPLRHSRRSPERDFPTHGALPILAGMKRLAPFLIALTLGAAPAQSTTQDDVITARVLPGWQMADGHHMAALQFDLAEGWKTYWRAPGDAGIPPVFDWSGSQNVKSVQIHWPSPVVFHNNGMQTIGYHEALTLPVEITPIDPTRPVTLKVAVDLGVCEKICMPASLRLQAALQTPGAPDPGIKAALGDLPLTGAEAGLSAIRCEVTPIADGLRLTASIDLPRRGANETVAFETRDRAIWVAEARTRRNGDTMTSTTDLVAGGGAPFALDRSDITVTVLGEGRAIEIAGCPAP